MSLLLSASRISTRQSSAQSKRRLDPLTPSERSILMAGVRQRHTGPELIVRSLLHSLRLRFTVNGPLNRSLPSRPDVVLPRWKTVILVHGCFWHRHANCRLATTPRTRTKFWVQKFTANVARDRLQRSLLRRAGWRVVTVWECETRSATRLIARFTRLFEIPKRIAA
jgi:DNA mismatch endonuclease (patch repair protein)